MIAWAILAAALGVLGWSFTEYGMHHWNGHLMKGRTLFSRQHLAHHADQRYFAPWWMKLLAAAPVVAGLGWGGSALVGIAPGVAFTAGFAGAWFFYEWMHRAIHVAPPRTAYGRWMRRNHLAHHYTCPKENHGVTSPLWDLIFRTRRPCDVVRVPARKAMPWMIDPSTGELWSDYRDEYVLTGRRGPGRTSP